MSKKMQGLILVAIVVLAVAQIGLYLRGPEIKIVEKLVNEKKFGGPDTGVNCLSFAGSRAEVDGSPIVTSNCLETLEMASATSTLAWDNLTNETRYVEDIELSIEGSDAAADAFVIFVATTGPNVSLPDPRNGSAFVLDGLADVGGRLFYWVVATGTKATTTSMVKLPLRNMLKAAPSGVNHADGFQVYQNAGFAIAARDRIVAKLYAYCNFQFVTGQTNCVPAQGATSTSRGFDLRMLIKHRD